MAAVEGQQRDREHRKTNVANWLHSVVRLTARTTGRPAKPHFLSIPYWVATLTAKPPGTTCGKGAAGKVHPESIEKAQLRQHRQPGRRVAEDEECRRRQEREDPRP